MVSLPSPIRLPMLRRSVADFARQSHVERELVVVLDQAPSEARAAAREAVEVLGAGRARVIEPDGERTLGALRNLSIEAARGEILCVWDDDDLHHPRRIEGQLAALETSGVAATCLQEVMQFVPSERRLYLTNWRASPPTVKPSCLMWRSGTPVGYPQSGPRAQLGEDLEIIAQLQAMDALHGHAGDPHLYVYVFHGHNTCDHDHHRMLIERLAVSRGLLRRREDTLREGLAAHDFGPGEVSVEGSNGPAFRLAG